MVGLILAGTDLRSRVEKLVLPLRDAFAAAFFFAFGLIIDPAQIGDVAIRVAGAVALSIVVNLGAAVIAARSHRLEPAAAANVAFTLVGRGSFR
jgi:monovalent cation:H+ antiporter-2, CPA2 family